MTWDKIKNMVKACTDSSIIPFVSMVLIVIFLIVSLPYYLGRALDNQTDEIAELREGQIHSLNLSLANMTAIGKHNEDKLDLILSYLNNTK